MWRRTWALDGTLRRSCGGRPQITTLQSTARRSLDFFRRPPGPRRRASKSILPNTVWLVVEDSVMTSSVRQPTVPAPTQSEPAKMPNRPAAEASNRSTQALLDELRTLVDELAVTEEVVSAILPNGQPHE